MIKLNFKKNEAMIKKIALLLFISFLFVNCSRENEFRIDKGQVGLLNKKTVVNELKTIFENDSLIIPISNAPISEKDVFFIDNDEYEIYSNEGQKLLEIVPMQQNDSTSKIKSIQIFNPDYITKKGIGLTSTFKDIQTNYVIDKVETTLTSATLYIDELNATIAFDKEELGISKFSREEITIDQIPDISKIKYFTIWFN